jgi:hypothetical protein
MRTEVEKYITTLREQAKAVNEHARVLNDKLAAAEKFLVTLDDSPVSVTSNTAPVQTGGVVRQRRKSNGATNYGVTGRTIEALIATAPKTFTIEDIFSRSQHDGSTLTRDQIGQALSKMGRAGKLSVVQKGAGRRPHQYALAQPLL